MKIEIQTEPYLSVTTTRDDGLVTVRACRDTASAVEEVARHLCPAKPLDLNIVFAIVSGLLLVGVLVANLLEVM